MEKKNLEAKLIQESKEKCLLQTKIKLLNSKNKLLNAKLSKNDAIKKNNSFTLKKQLEKE